MQQGTLRKKEKLDVKVMCHLALVANQCQILSLPYLFLSAVLTHREVSFQDFPRLYGWTETTEIHWHLQRTVHPTIFNTDFTMEIKVSANEKKKALYEQSEEKLTGDRYSFSECIYISRRTVA